MAFTRGGSRFAFEYANAHFAQRRPQILKMPLLQLDEIAKEFTGTRALHNVSFALDGGEVVGLVGENGAGKSTLIKLLAGVHRPDHGTIVWQGSPVDFPDPRSAISAGIATIHQELAYF